MPSLNAGVAAWVLFLYGIATTWIAHSPSKPKSLPDWAWTFILGGFKAVKVDKATDTVDIGGGLLDIHLDKIGVKSGPDNSPVATDTPVSEPAGVDASDVSEAAGTITITRNT